MFQLTESHKKRLYRPPPGYRFNALPRFNSPDIRSKSCHQEVASTHTISSEQTKDNGIGDKAAQEVKEFTLESKEVSPPDHSQDESVSHLPGQGDGENTEMISSVRSNAANRFKALKLKQCVMEAVMRKLLQSIKELKISESKNGKNIDLDKERRLKVTRMMQLLVLQRRNLEMQNEALTKCVYRLRKKLKCLQQHSESCILENIELSSQLKATKCEQDRKDMQIKAMTQLNSNMEQQIKHQTETKIAIENAAYEIKRLRSDNETLREAHSQLESMLSERCKERETATLVNAQLRQDLDRFHAELANLRMRCERVTNENQTMRSQISKFEAGQNDISCRAAEMDRLRDHLDRLQLDHQRLQTIYTVEADNRRLLHNQLQQVRGNVRVLCRFRPITGDRRSPFEFCAMDKIFFPGNLNPSTMSYQRQLGFDQPAAYTAKDEQFSFNRVFRENSKQSEIFEEIQPLVASFVDGYNVCILAYGPTGSGKTYTMQGTQQEPGISSRVVSEIFSLCSPLQGIWKIDVSVAMLEIYNEVIYDLLSHRIRPVKLSDNGTDVRLVEAEERVINNETDMLFWIEKGYARRKMTSTKLNVESSRSHLVIRLQLSLVSSIDEKRRAATLVLCDLAGSESAERIDARGELHVETGFINKSLVTLTRVFETLRKRTMSGLPTSSNVPTVPYRDSKLTHLLKPCLGGQAKCVLILTASSDIAYLERSLKALEFGQQVMQVALGKPVKNNKILITRPHSRS